MQGGEVEDHLINIVNGDTTCNTKYDKMRDEKESVKEFVDTLFESIKDKVDGEIENKTGTVMELLKQKSEEFLKNKPESLLSQIKDSFNEAIDAKEKIETGLGLLIGEDVKRDFDQILKGTIQDALGVEELSKQNIIANMTSQIIGSKHDKGIGEQSLSTDGYVNCNLYKPDNFKNPFIISGTPVWEAMQMLDTDGNGLSCCNLYKEDGELVGVAGENVQDIFGPTKKEAKGGLQGLLNRFVKRFLYAQE